MARRGENLLGKTALSHMGIHEGFDEICSFAAVRDGRWYWGLGDPDLGAVLVTGERNRRICEYLFHLRFQYSQRVFRGGHSFLGKKNAREKQNRRHQNKSDLQKHTPRISRGIVGEDRPDQKTYFKALLLRFVAGSFIWKHW